MSVEQAIRRSHCSRKDKEEHECAGTCTITPAGIELSCKLCGGDERMKAAIPKPVAHRAREILKAAGLEWANLSERVQERVCREVLREQERVCREVLRDHCPGCGETRPIDLHYGPSSYECRCGWSWYVHAGWESREGRERKRAAYKARVVALDESSDIVRPSVEDDIGF